MLLYVYNPIKLSIAELTDYAISVFLFCRWWSPARDAAASGVQVEATKGEQHRGRGHHSGAMTMPRLHGPGKQFFLLISHVQIIKLFLVQVCLTMDPISVSKFRELVGN
jgi:hypothetical protein